MAEQILPEGIRFFPRGQKAPDFVLGTMVVTVDELLAFANSRPDLLTDYNGKRQLKLQLLNSKQGKLYASVDTFKPTQQGNAPQQAAAPSNDFKDLPF
jgi:hypothetical protein